MKIRLLQDVNEELALSEGSRFKAEGKKGEIRDWPDSLAEKFIKAKWVELPEDFPFICASCETLFKTRLAICSKCGGDNLVTTFHYKNLKIGNTTDGQILSETKEVRQVTQDDESFYKILLQHDGKEAEITLSGKEIMTSVTFKMKYLLEFREMLRVPQATWEAILTGWLNHASFKQVKEELSTSGVMRNKILAMIEEGFPTRDLEEAVRNENRFTYDDNGNVLYASRHLEMRRDQHTTLEKLRHVFDNYLIGKAKQIRVSPKRREYFWVFDRKKLDLKHADEFIEEKEDDAK